MPELSKLTKRVDRLWFLRSGVGALHRERLEEGRPSGLVGYEDYERAKAKAKGLRAQPVKRTLVHAVKWCRGQCIPLYVVLSGGGVSYVEETRRPTLETLGPEALPEGYHVLLEVCNGTTGKLEAAFALSDRALERLAQASPQPALPGLEEDNP